MDWTDIMRSHTSETTLAQETDSAMDYTRVIETQGVTVLCSAPTSRTQTAAALKLLRGFGAAERRLVLCDTSQLVVGRQFGHEVVEIGAASVLVSCGISGREVGIGARDAGLDLSSVVVCGRTDSGVQVLINRLMPGDAVLLLGVDEQMSRQIVEALAARRSMKPALAA